MKLPDVHLAGIGVCLPGRVSADAAIAAGDYTDREARRSGWQSVTVAGRTPAPDLAVAAATQAMSRSGHAADDIGLLLHADLHHQGPDLWPPQQYIQRFTIGGTAPAVELRQGCNGMIGGIGLAAAYLAMSGSPASLITSADNFGSPHIDRWRAFPNVALGDAGTALVLSTRGGFARVLSFGSCSVPRLEEQLRGNEPLYPPSCVTGGPTDLTRRAMEYAENTMASIDDDLGVMTEAARSMIDEACADADLTVRDVRRIVHVNWGNANILRSILAPLGFDLEQGTHAFGATVGHLGAGDQVAGLEHLLTSAELDPGDIVLMFSAGAGLALACALVQIRSVPDWATP